MSKFHNIDQNSDEWFYLRSGKFTASSISSLFMGKKTKGYTDTIKKIAIEKLSNEPVETEFFGTAYTERGHELEGLAVQEYEKKTFTECTNGGFYELDEWTGASPDRVIEGFNGGLECKCVGYRKFVDYLHDEKQIEKDYFKQVQAQMYVCGFDWVDIAVYYPNYKLLTVRVLKDAQFQESIKEEIETAKTAVNKLIEYIKQFRVEA